uniref:NADH-ubiquinone oxidoreductase chain 4 n=1 Tax=Lineus viridis TaxID=56195 RepID=C6GCT1_9BILA|nr:NADH dehydrogenase subunit 4 [Lineus viridis]ACO40321.1 NADH dehydrogenase subunit 4 [Lineus viridis]
MLIFFGSFSLFFISFFYLGYAWYIFCFSFFVLCFFGLFFLKSFGWWTSDIFFSFDITSFSLVLLSLWLASLMLLANWTVYSSRSFEKIFSGVVVFLTFLLVVCFSVDNFFLFYVFFEFSLIPTFLLILGWGYQPERLGASMYMIMYTVGASLPLLSCLFYLFSGQGHLSFHLYFSFCFSGFYGGIFFFFLVLAFLVKIPVFFVHLWLPKAHVEAPVAGSMVLAGVLLKLGGYGLIRIFYMVNDLFDLSNVLYFGAIMWGGVVTAVICLRQVDLKGLIAYSSIGHMSLFVGGVLTNNSWGWQGGLLMLLAHGLCSPAMFALANVSYESVGSRSMLLIKGVLSFFPFLTLMWFLICSCNMAAPPSLNLASEIMLFISLLGDSWIWGVIVGALSFLGGAYSLYLYTSGQHGKVGSFCFCYAPIKLRSFYMILCHWVPLNIFFLSLGLLAETCV